MSVPRTYNVLVPYDDGRVISLPLFAHVEDAHVELSYEYSQDTAVPHDMYGVHTDTDDEAEGVSMFILSAGFNSE